MNAMSKTSKSGGCGCGGAGKSGGCGCGTGVQPALCSCGSVGCNTCSNQGFVRPRFFAGQLLTEEDLQKLIDYTVAKNRLHNQRLWGDGVVCGLEVSCNPCGGGKVTVKPGYALDCCGNDLVLSCPQELDINAMVRDLKRSLRGGHDCGDPCPPKKKPEPAGEPTAGSSQVDPATGIVVRPSSVPKDSAEADEQQPKDTTRHYCLYLRYCESLTEPVSAYATDEGCSYQSCQPTRVSEGVSFELRCNECADHQPDIRDRICECIGDVDSAYQTTLRSNTFYTAARLLEPVPDVALNNGSQAARNFLNSVSALRNARIPQPTAAAPAPVQPAEAAPALAPPAAPLEADKLKLEVRSTIDTSGSAAAISADEFEGWLFDVHTASAHLASYYLAQKKQDTANAIAAANDPTEEEVRAAEKQFLDTSTSLKAVVKDVDTSQLARGYYDAALGHASELVTKRSSNSEPLLQQMAKGLMLVASDFQSSTQSIAAMKEELLDRLDQSPRLGDCQLRFDVEAIRIPGPDGTESDWLKAFRQIHAAWVRYLKDCVCGALNPPCGSCDDPAVLLACINVKDCEVVEICNLKRKFVISGPALRYWFPPLNMLGDKIESLCCPDPICIEEETDPAASKRDMTLLETSRYGLGQKIPGRINFSIFQFLCRSLNKRSYINRRIPSLGEMITRRRVGEDFSWQDSLRYAGALLMRRVGVPAFAIREPVLGVGSRFDALAANLGDKGFARMVVETLESESSRVDKAVAELTEKKVKAATAKINASATKDRKEVKQLSKENAELQKTIKEMGDRAKELLDRVTKLEKGTPNE